MKRVSTVLLVCLACSILVSSAAAQRRRGRAQAKPVDVEGTYTNMEYTESGDIGGATVIIIMANKEEGEGWDYYAVVQFAEGLPEPPVLTKAKVTGSTVTFSVPAGGSDTINYIGRVTAAGMTLKVSGRDGADFGLLKRKICR